MELRVRLRRREVLNVLLVTILILLLHRQSIWVIQVANFVSDSVKEVSQRRVPVVHNH